MTVRESLVNISLYPIASSFLDRVAILRTLDLEAILTADILESQAFLLAEADVLMWLSVAPNLSEGGMSLNTLVPDRDALRKRANATYQKFGDSAYVAESSTVFGYKGDSL